MRVLPLIALALLAAVADAQETAARVEPGPRYAREVAAGDTEALESVRIELQKSIAVGGAGANEVAAWRYDWAYLNWRIGQMLPPSENKRRKSLLKESEAQLDLVLEHLPESAEAHSLRGSAIGERIEGGFSAALLGRRSGKAHELAIELASENPRVALQHGISLYYTPKTFGGGNEAAVEELRRAVGLFDQQPDDSAWPNWGRVDALVWLGIVLAEEGSVDEARSLVESALDLDPTNVWVRERLAALD